jgi:hypothetical protein
VVGAYGGSAEAFTGAIPVVEVGFMAFSSRAAWRAPAGGSKGAA